MRSPCLHGRHLVEDLGDWVVLAPALAAPLHAGDEREQDGGQPPRAVVVDEVGAVEGDQPAREHDQPPADVTQFTVISIRVIQG